MKPKKIFRIVLLNKTQHEIEAEKLDIVTHKILGQSIKKHINQDDIMFIPIRSIASMVEDEVGIKKERDNKRKEEIDFQHNKKDGESKGHYLKRKAK